MDYSPDDMLTPDQVSDLLGIPYPTLASWRKHEGRGPKFVTRFAGYKQRIWYRRGDVMGWAEERRAATASADWQDHAAKAKAADA